MKAIILAAGLGTRLRPLTYALPKPLLQLGDKTIVEHIVSWLLNNQIDEIYIILSRFGKLVELYLEKFKDLKINFIYSKPLGTAGQLKILEKIMKSTFIVTYCDVITDFNLKDMINFHKNKNSILTLATYAQTLPIRYGIITHNKEGKIMGWDEKPSILIKINSGIYVMEPKIFKYIEKDKIIQMNELVKKLIESKENVYAYTFKANYFDIGTLKDYIKIVKEFDKKLGEI